MIMTDPAIFFGDAWPRGATFSAAGKALRIGSSASDLRYATESSPVQFNGAILGSSAGRIEVSSGKIHCEGAMVLGEDLEGCDLAFYALAGEVAHSAHSTPFMGDNAGAMLSRTFNGGLGNWVAGPDTQLSNAWSRLNLLPQAYGVHTSARLALTNMVAGRRYFARAAYAKPNGGIAGRAVLRADGDIESDPASSAYLPGYLAGELVIFFTATGQSVELVVEGGDTLSDNTQFDNISVGEALRVPEGAANAAFLKLNASAEWDKWGLLIGNARATAKLHCLQPIKSIESGLLLPLDSDPDPRNFSGGGEEMVSAAGAFCGRAGLGAVRTMRLAFGLVTPSEYDIIRPFVDNCLRRAAPFFLVPDASQSGEAFFCWSETKALSLPMVRGLYQVPPITIKTRGL